MRLHDRIREQATQAGVFSAHAENDPLAWGRARQDYRQLCDELCVLEGWTEAVRSLLYVNMQNLEGASELRHLHEGVRGACETCSPQQSLDLSSGELLDASCGSTGQSTLDGNRVRP